MGLVNSKDFLGAGKKKIDEATSNSSLSNIRYVMTEKPKWKVFKKIELKPVPVYQTSTKKGCKGCPCGNNGPCKQKVTPKGVTIHYPQKKKRFGALKGRYKPPKIDKGYLSNKSRVVNQVKIIRPKKFPTWRLDKIIHKSPYDNSNGRPHSGPLQYGKRRLRRRKAKTELFKSKPAGLFTL